MTVTWPDNTATPPDETPWPLSQPVQSQPAPPWQEILEALNRIADALEKLV